MAVDGDPAVDVCDLTGFKIERVDIGDPPGTVDDTVGLGRPLRAAVDEHHAKPAAG
jgi:hypothetical protein